MQNVRRAQLTARLQIVGHLCLLIHQGAGAAVIAYTLMKTAKLYGVDPQAWLTNVLAAIADTKATYIADLLPWTSAQQDCA